MTILQFPQEKADEIMPLISPLSKEDVIEYTIKLKTTLSDEKLEELKKLGVVYMTPVP